MFCVKYSQMQRRDEGRIGAGKIAKENEDPYEVLNPKFRIQRYSDRRMQSPAHG